MKKYLEYMNAAERKIADKLNALTNIDTFWDDVRKFTKNVHSDRSISIWQSLAEIRLRYYTYDYSKEVFIKEA